MISGIEPNDTFNWGMDSLCVRSQGSALGGAFSFGKFVHAYLENEEKNNTLRCKMVVGECKQKKIALQEI